MRCPRRPGRTLRELGPLVPLNLRDGLSDLVHPALAEIGVYRRESAVAIPGVHHLDRDPHLGHLLAGESLQRPRPGPLVGSFCTRT